MNFTDILPILLEGKKITRKDLNPGDYLCASGIYLERYNLHGESCGLFDINLLNVTDDNWEKWSEPKPCLVATYLVPTRMFGTSHTYIEKTYKVGNEPEGAVLKPKTERKEII